MFPCINPPFLRVMFTLSFLSLLPLSVFPIPAPSLPTLILPSSASPTANALLFPGISGSESCADRGTTNLWSGISALQPPNLMVPDPTFPPIPVQTFTPPPPSAANSLGCDLIAHFSFSSVGTNTKGNTQTIALPVRTKYFLTFAMATWPGARVETIRAWAAEPGKGKYTNVQTMYVDTDRRGINGTMEFSVDMGKEPEARHVHFEADFTEARATGVFALFTVGASADS